MEVNSRVRITTAGHIVAGCIPAKPNNTIYTIIGMVKHPAHIGIPTPSDLRIAFLIDENGTECMVVLAGLTKVSHTLEVTSNQKGGFYSAKLDGQKINREELFILLNIEGLEGRTLDYYLDIWAEGNPDFEVKQSEIDVS